MRGAMHGRSSGVAPGILRVYQPTFGARRRRQRVHEIPGLPPNQSSDSWVSAMIRNDAKAEPVTRYATNSTRRPFPKS